MSTRNVYMVVVASALAGNSASAVVVDGTIHDSASVPLGGVYVCVLQPSPPVDTVIECVETDDAGYYASTLPTAGTDVYVRVEWDFSLKPVSFYNNGTIQLLDFGVAAFNPTQAYTAKSSTAVTLTGDTTIDLLLDQPQPAGLPTLRAGIQRTLDFMRSNHGSVSWTANYNVPVHVIVEDLAFFDPSDQSIIVSLNTFNGMGTAFDEVTLFHEVGHMIHYRHNGNMMPTSSGGSCVGDHTVDSEEPLQCAFEEAYASYIGQLVAEQPPFVFSPFFTSYRDPLNKHWLGGAESDDGIGEPSGLNGSATPPNFESGENVEGAIAGVMFGLSNDPAFAFEDVLNVMMTGRPASAGAFRAGFVTHAGGPYAPGTLRLYEIMQQHGFPYSRMRFDMPAFIADPIPDSAPAPGSEAAGHHRQIDDITFLSGTVQFQTDDFVDLGVAATVPNDQVRIAFQPAEDGTSASPPDEFALTTQFHDAADIKHLDTTHMGVTPGDGDWDLVLLSANSDGFVDHLLPTWIHDVNVLVDSDERYLKKAGTWYDSDRDPATDPDKGGKVIVDNTPPTVTNFKP
jgi:hypothetical protein